MIFLNWGCKSVVMRNYQALISFLPLKKLRYLDILGKSRKQDNLFNALKEHKQVTDEQLMELLNLNGKYRAAELSKIKDATFDTLVNTILVTQCESKNHTQKVHRSLRRAHCLCEILIFENNLAGAVEIAESKISKAIEYEFYDLAASFAAILRYYYSVVDFKKNLHDRYKDIYLSATTKLEIEQRMHQLYCEFCVEFNISNFERISRIAKEAEILFQNGISFKSALFGFNLIIFYFISIGDYDNAIRQSLDALHYFENRNKWISRPTFTFHYKLIPIYILKGRFVDAVQSLKICMDTETEGSFNMNLARRYLIVLAFHQKEYEKAYKIAESEDDSQMKGKLAESWKLLRAYALLLTERVSDIRLGKLLNEFKAIEGDKTAYNINIQILTFLCRYKRGEHDALIEKLTGLERYVSRYLQESKNIRPKIFIQCLIDAAKNSFRGLNPDYWQEQLQKYPRAETGQDVDLELVPFESLMEVVFGGN